MNIEEVVTQAQAHLGAASEKVTALTESVRQFVTIHFILQVAQLVVLLIMLIIMADIVSQRRRDK